MVRGRVPGRRGAYKTRVTHGRVTYIAKKKLDIRSSDGPARPVMHGEVGAGSHISY